MGKWQSPRLARLMTDKSQLHTERDRGILTERDRDYLLGEVTYQDQQQQRNRRRHIRNRLKNGIIDFGILNRLEPRDRKQIVASLNDSSIESQKDIKSESDLLTEGLIGAIRFLYLLSYDADLPFEDILQQGVRKGEKERTGRLVSGVDLEINYSQTSPNESNERALGELAGQSLSSEEKDAVRGYLKDALDVLEEKESTKSPNEPDT